jgi:hypothetical protein
MLVFVRRIADRHTLAAQYSDTVVYRYIIQQYTVTMCRARALSSRSMRAAPVEGETCDYTLGVHQIISSCC